MFGVVGEEEGIVKRKIEEVNLYVSGERDKYYCGWKIEGFLEYGWIFLIIKMIVFLNKIMKNLCFVKDFN